MYKFRSCNILYFFPCITCQSYLGEAEVDGHSLRDVEEPPVSGQREREPVQGLKHRHIM